MKAVSHEQLRCALETLSAEYDVRAPIALQDGTRSFGRIEEGPLAVLGGRIPLKTTCLFFPQFDNVLTVSESSGVCMAQPVEKPLLVLGMTSDDLDCLEFTDKFFSDVFHDEVYHGKRNRAIVIGLSGRCGVGGEFFRIAGGKCDLELVVDGDQFIVMAYSEAGKDLAECLPSSEDVDSIEALQQESDALPDNEAELVGKASEIMLAGGVPEEFWAEIEESCIECTSCNYACPTCTCFEVYDLNYGDRVERARMWDSCLLDGFMREASGHNPMGAAGNRTRRRIHHKLVADRIRWGHITCFACGRCDDVCPTGIGIFAVSREIVKRYVQPENSVE